MDREVNYKYYTDVLDSYKINESLTSFNILHLYPKEEAFPNGYYDSKFFDLHIFNTKTKEKRIIENRDGLTFLENVFIDIIRVYIDGSFFIRLKEFTNIDIFQDCYIGRVNYEKRNIF